MDMTALLKRDQILSSWVLVSKDGSVRNVRWERNRIMNDYGLTPADFLILDPYFDHSPTICVKPAAIVVCLGGIRGIISMDGVLISCSLYQDVNVCVKALENQLGAQGEPLENEYNSKLEPTRRNPSTDDWPFELRALEVVIRVMFFIYQSQIKDLESKLEKVDNALRSNIREENLEKMRLISMLDEKILMFRNEIKRLMDGDGKSLCLAKPATNITLSHRKTLLDASYVLSQKYLTHLDLMRKVTEDSSEDFSFLDEFQIRWLMLFLFGLGTLVGLFLMFCSLLLALSTMW